MQEYPQFIVVRENGPKINIRQTKITKGPNNGASFFEIDREKTSIEDVKAAWSTKDFDEWIWTKLRQLGKALTDEATDETSGFFDFGQFEKMFVDLSARGEKMSDILERFMDIQEQVGQKMEAASAPGISAEAASALYLEARDLVRLGKKLKNDMENKRREREAKKLENAAKAGTEEPATAGVTNA